MKNKNKISPLGLVVLLLWDISWFYWLYLYLSVWTGLTASLALLSGNEQSFTTILNAYWIYFVILFIFCVLIDFVIAKDYKWMIVIGVVELIWLVIGGNISQSIFPAICCVLLIVAGVVGIKSNNSTKNIQETKEVNNVNEK